MPQSQSDILSNTGSRIICSIGAIAIICLGMIAGANLITIGLTLSLSTLAIWFSNRILIKKKTTQTSEFSEKSTEDIKRETLETLANALPRAIILLDQNANVIHANQAAFRMLSPNIIGRPISAYLRTSEIRPYLERAFEGEIPPSLSAHILQPAERYIDVDFAKAVSLDPTDPNASVVFAVLADRTQDRIGREQRADFLANASHELKTPIASMKGFIETLRGHAKDDPTAREKFLKIMAEQAERMERLVTDLLSLRRIESREHLAPSETADLKKAIEAARDSLTPLAEDKGVDMSITLPEDKTAYTSGKTDECIQLFLNLMENGIKLSPKGSKLNVSLERLPRWNGQAFSGQSNLQPGFRRIVNLAPADSPAWRVIITDQGPGFSKAHLPRIGERFYRVAGDLPAQEKGTGLGLAIVKHIVMRHRAGLFVKSAHVTETEDGSHGTSFCVIFVTTTPKPTEPLV